MSKQLDCVKKEGGEKFAYVYWHMGNGIVIHERNCDVEKVAHYFLN